MAAEQTGVCVHTIYICQINIIKLEILFFVCVLNHITYEKL